DYYSITLPIYKKETPDSAMTGNSAEKAVAGVLMMTVSTENMMLLAEEVLQKVGFLQLVIFVLVAVLDVLMVNLLLQPFKRLKQQVNVVAEGNLDQEIAVDVYTETRDISDTFSRTLGRLKSIDQSRQEFVSNVSHELKTPITSIRVLADSLQGMEDAPVELYREFMEDISDEIDREAKIIDDLLTLVRMDRSTPDLNIATVSINTLIEQILKRLRPIAKKRNIEVVYESVREVKADVDEVKLSLAITNLVENAIKYNQEEGWVHVTLDADHKFFYVKVIDNGVGIPAEFQDHVFERFYRVDKARSRETGGTGLGLAITKNIVLLHQGAIKLQSKEGEGTTFTVRIPLNYIP
ncbi:MAG: ATP-binding protein, partial [Clostridiaceae bacterium]|nr:ATP-binding protein [Clostridiaceae bacterium]